MFAREPVAVQLKAHNFGSRIIILVVDPMFYYI